MKKQEPTIMACFGNIKTDVWEHRTENGTTYEVTFTRVYQEPVEQLGSSFDDRGVSNLMRAAMWAHCFINDCDPPKVIP